MRGSLHAHILCWFERRSEAKGYKPIEPVRRVLPGTKHRQRPQTQTVAPLAKYQEDHVYQVAKVGRIITEMVRPSVKGIVDRRRYGGWDYERLRIAGLARCIQTKMALHSCTTKYCLQNRSSCRFFFPWPSRCYHCYIRCRYHIASLRISVLSRHLINLAQAASAAVR